MDSTGIAQGVPVLICVSPSGGISNPSAGGAPVSNGTATVYSVTDRSIVSMGPMTIYNADPNGPSGGIPASTLCAVALSPFKANAFVTGCPGYVSSLTRFSVNQLPGNGLL